MTQGFRALALLLVLYAGAGLVHGHEVDVKRLPLGDGKVSNSPAQGQVWVCPARFGGGGAYREGDWIRADGTFDFTAKPVVDGRVSWPRSFHIAVVGNTRVVTGNALPTHPTGAYPISPGDDAFRFDRNPNRIAAQDLRLELPKDPTEAPRPSCVPMGPIGFLVTGAVFFNALDARGDDALAHEIQDACQGHPERSGTYHYHSLTTCLEPAGAAKSHSPLVGYALDGFGIFGRYGEGGALVGNGDLDACHGHHHVIEWDGKRADMYHYHATWEYPYTVGCFRGVPQRLYGLRHPEPPPRRGRPGP